MTRAVAAEMLIERDAIVQKSEQSGQPALAVLDRLRADVLAIDRKKVERVAATTHTTRYILCTALTFRVIWAVKSTVA